MRTLVTGGAGFIGSHLCESLLTDGHRVDVIDDLSTGGLQNIKDYIGNKSFTFINASVLNEKMMYTLIDKCEMIYHLAAAVGVKLIVNEPVKTIETNIDMRRRVPSVEKIRTRVGYTPKTSLKETLEIMINHFQTELDRAA